MNSIFGVFLQVLFLMKDQLNLVSHAHYIFLLHANSQKTVLF